MLYITMHGAKKKNIKFGTFLVTCIFGLDETSWGHGPAAT